MSSDGLFQDETSQSIVNAVGDYLKYTKNEKNPINASSYLIKKALESASEHEIGRRSIENFNLSWILNIAPGARRPVHDDLSVIVVFFDQKNKFVSDSPDTKQQLFTPPTLLRAMRVTQQQDKSQPQEQQIRSNL